MIDKFIEKKTNVMDIIQKDCFVTLKQIYTLYKSMYFLLICTLSQ